MYAQNEQVIKDFYGRVIGKVYTLYNGDKEARTFTGKCVGKYKKSLDITTDFYGRKISNGDTVVSTLYMPDPDDRNNKR